MRSSLLEWYSEEVKAYRALLGTEHVWYLAKNNRWYYVKGMEPYPKDWLPGYGRRDHKFLSQEEANEFLSKRMLDIL